MVKQMQTELPKKYMTDNQYKNLKFTNECTKDVLDGKIHDFLLQTFYYMYTYFSYT